MLGAPQIKHNGFGLVTWWQRISAFAGVRCYQIALSPKPLRLEEVVRSAGYRRRSSLSRSLEMVSVVASIPLEDLDFFVF
ncbi:MAG TPA: hypothetical protein DEB66_14790 [Micrococcaceae bacterium]|nr:hypothetical protein [Micrococcaceae bacterium]